MVQVEQGAYDKVPAMTRREFARVVAATCAVMAVGGLAGCAGADDSDAAATGESALPSGTVEGTPPSSPQEYEERSRTLFLFDTVVTLTAYCSQEAMDAAAERCEYFDSIFSRTVDSSDIGRINAAGGKPVEVAPETADIVRKALAYCAESDGAFDITIGAVSSLWDFKQGVVPEADVLAEAVKHVDYTKVRVEGTTIQLLDAQAKLDLGGIAKGYIADDLCAQLISAGCDSGFVNLGGNVKTIGLKPDGSPWHVGVQDPNDVHDAVLAAVYAQDASVVTSGLYERQFERGGRKYWHILDPATGYPVETDLASATIVSSASLDGDGYTKPLFMLGRDEALAWMNAKEGIEGLVVGEDGAILQTDGCEAELM